MIVKDYVTLADGQMHFRHVEGDGVPIVFLHRTPKPSHSFVPLMRALSGIAPLYAFDTPGFGASFDPPGLPSIADYAGWIGEALDRLSLAEAHLFGHHTGVLIASEFARTDPARVQSLMLNGIPFLNADERAAFRARLQRPSLPDPDGAALMDTWQRMLPLFPDFDAQLVQDEFRFALRAMDGRHQAFAALCDFDLPAAFSGVTCPVLAMTAEDDIFMPQFDRVRAARPDAVTHVFGRAGVASPELQTAEIAAAIEEFLNRL